MSQKLKYLKSRFNDVIGTVNRLTTRMQQEVLQEMLKIISGLDEDWVAEEATEFKERAQKASKLLEESIQKTKRTHDGLKSAEEKILNADQRAANLISNLNTKFRKIY